MVLFVHLVVIISPPPHKKIHLPASTFEVEMQTFSDSIHTSHPLLSPAPEALSDDTV